MTLGIQLEYGMYFNVDHIIDSGLGKVVYPAISGLTTPPPPVGTIRIYDIPTGDITDFNYNQTAHINQPIGGGTCLLTTYGEIMLRTGGDGNATIPTWLEFRALSDFAATQSPIQMTPHVIGNDINFGFLADQQGDHILIKLGPAVYPYETWLILERSAGSWGVLSSPPGDPAGEWLNNLCMGENYGYGVAGTSSYVALVRWNGTWSETKVDLEPFMGGGRWVYKIGVCPATNEVIVIGGTETSVWRIYVFNEDLTTLLRSSSTVLTGHVIGGMRHWFPTDDTVWVCDGDPVSHSSKMRHIRVSDLTEIRNVDCTAVDYINKDEIQYTAWMHYTRETPGYYTAAHFFSMNWWPDIIPIEGDVAVPVGVELDITMLIEFCPMPGTGSDQCIIGQTSIPPGVGQIVCGQEAVEERVCD